MLSAAVAIIAAAVAACTGHPAPRVLPPATRPAATTTSTTIPVATTVPLPPPPYGVMTMTVPLVDPTRPTVSHGTRISGSRAITTVVWYPAVGSRWPLVVFAHGFRVGPETYSQLCRAWAAAGYVVAAPRFPLADPAVAGAAIDERDIDNEPGDVLFVIASLADPAGPVLAAVDPARVAVAGHSDGAEAALAVSQAGFPNIKAVIAMSGQPVPTRQAPSPPLLAIQGDQDNINPPWRSQAVYNQATGPRFLLTLLGGGHLPPFTAGSRWQAALEAVTVDFLNHYAAETAPSDAQMLADANHPGLTDLK